MAKKRNLPKLIESVTEKISAQQKKIEEENAILNQLITEKESLEKEHFENQFAEIVNNARENNMSIEDIKAIVLGTNKKKKSA